MFPFDRIKIDKSFTQNLTKRGECAAIISATLTLAQSLDIATTAEGVETVDHCRFLRLAGVTSLQGYLFKRRGLAKRSSKDVEGSAATVCSAAGGATMEMMEPVTIKRMAGARPAHQQHEHDHHPKDGEHHEDWAHCYLAKFAPFF